MGGGRNSEMTRECETKQNRERARESAREGEVVDIFSIFLF